MKTRVLAVVGLLVLGTLGLAAVSRANGRGDRDGAIQRFDTNHNGVLDPDEQAAMQQARATHEKDLIARYDKDGDGALSESERQAIPPGQRMHARRAHMMQRFDTNANGVLDPDEKAAMKQAHEDMLKRFDADGDGKLSPAERQAAHADHQRQSSTPGQPPVAQ